MQKKIGLAPRLAALKAILAFKNGKGFVLDNLQNTCANLPENDRSLSYEIALGTTRTIIDINKKLKKFLKKTPQEPIKTILEISFYQLFYTRIPSYAAINSAVELSRASGCGEYEAKFVNAVLRNALRSDDGAENGSVAPMQWIRINPQKTTIESIIAELKLTEPKILFNRFINVPNAGEALRNPFFAKGFYSFQDPASFYVEMFLKNSGLVDCSAASCGEKLIIWDACAAPGGKTAMLSEDYPNIFFVATDISKKRAEKLLDLKIRLDLKNVSVCICDSQNPPFAINFDCILLDVPCSNLGVVNRRPEAALRNSVAKGTTETTTPQHLEISEKQFNILTSASKKLKMNGVLIYSTCTQEKSETSAVIENFLANNADFVQEEFIFTDEPNIDKFFVARLRKIK